MSAKLATSCSAVSAYPNGSKRIARARIVGVKTVSRQLSIGLYSNACRRLFSNVTGAKKVSLTKVEKRIGEAVTFN